MKIYQISWYAQHFGRMQFFTRSDDSDKVKAAFDKWLAKYFEGAEPEKVEIMAKQLTESFQKARVEEVEVIE